MHKIALPLMLVASSLSFADTHDHEHEQAQLGSHVHGMAQLDVVQEGSMLLASLKAPAADLVGLSMWHMKKSRSIRCTTWSGA